MKLNTPYTVDTTVAISDTVTYNITSVEVVDNNAVLAIQVNGRVLSMVRKEVAAKVGLVQVLSDRAAIADTDIHSNGWGTFESVVAHAALIALQEVA